MDRVRVGIAGFGTVGRATAEIISAHADLIAQRSGVRLEVTAVCRRSGVRTEDIPVGARVFTDWNQLVATSDVDVTVETMGGTEERCIAEPSTVWDKEKPGVVLAFVVSPAYDFTVVVDAGRGFQLPA